jgi:phosphoribosylanthranilate isomerase
MLKVCGINNRENLLQVLALEPDFMGFIFFDKSVRNCEIAANDIQQINFGKTKKVGVFVNEPLDKLLQIHDAFGLDYVQLHGNESAKYCERILMRGINYIKVFSIDETFLFEQIKAYQNAAFYLFDTKGDLPGGNGYTFDWNILRKYHGSTRFLLSGGISPEHSLIDLQHINPACIGLDINSKFEVSPGVKDIEKIKHFKRNYELN